MRLLVLAVARQVTWLVALETRSLAARQGAIARKVTLAVAVVASAGAQAWPARRAYALLRQRAVTGQVAGLLAVVAHTRRRTGSQAASLRAVTSQMAGLVAVVAHASNARAAKHPWGTFLTRHRAVTSQVAGLVAVVTHAGGGTYDPSDLRHISVKVIKLVVRHCQFRQESYNPAKSYGDAPLHPKGARSAVRASSRLPREQRLLASLVGARCTNDRCVAPLVSGLYMESQPLCANCFDQEKSLTSQFARNSPQPSRRLPLSLATSPSSSLPRFALLDVCSMVGVDTLFRHSSN